MAKNRTKSSRFPSNYGGGWVSPSQYLTECLCVLIAKQQKLELDDQFWNHEPWTKTFRHQVGLANKLLQTYPPEVILAQLRDRRVWKVRSFGAQWLLKPILEQKKREHDAQIAQQSQDQTTKKSTVQKPRRITTGKSLFTSLKEAGE
jgi:hypothetical protein